MSKKPMKKKAQKPSYKLLLSQVRQCGQDLSKANNEWSKEKSRADKYEKAYRELKNNLGQYLAMFANDYGVDPERAKKLQEAMFKEPKEECFDSHFDCVKYYTGDFGQIAMVPSPSSND